MRKLSRIVSVDSPAMLRILKVLSEAIEPMDGWDIAKAAFVAPNTWSNSYRHLLIHSGLIHISAWKHNTRGPFVPLYSIGAGEEAPKPEKIDQLARARNWKHRTGYNEFRKAQRRLANPGYALAALMGIPAKGKHFKEHHNKAGIAGRKE